MHKYRVVECRPGQNWVLLEGGIGRYHWARVLNVPPRVGSLLTGSRPHMGFGLLLCSRSALTFRAVFESINSDDPSFNAGWVDDPQPASWGGTKTLPILATLKAPASNRGMPRLELLGPHRSRAP